VKTKSAAVEDLNAVCPDPVLTIAEVKALRHILAAAHNAIPGGPAWAAKPLIEALDQKLKDVLS
jgi:hypothetical protein